MPSSSRLPFKQGTVGQWISAAIRFLAERGVPEGRANAEFIMAAILECGRNEALLQAARNLDAKQDRRFWSLIQKRAQRLPLAYVLGSQNFMGLDISVSPYVLIPRPETEELVAEAQKRLRALAKPSPVILEIGTGSGCVAIALARNIPSAAVYATDISPAALALALKNAEAHGVSRRIRFINEDLFKPAARASGWADLVVSNPPYIPSPDIDGLEPEVLREPRLALDGGRDGLEAIRAIVSGAPRHLRRGGLLLLEIGAGQGPAVLEIFQQAGGRDAEIRKDMQGLDRIAAARF